MCTWSTKKTFWGVFVAGSTSTVQRRRLRSPSVRPCPWTRGTTLRSTDDKKEGRNSPNLIASSSSSSNLAVGPDEANPSLHPAIMADPRPPPYPRPPCVLLERMVSFMEAAELTSGGASRDADVAAIIEAGGWSWSRVQMMGSVEEMEGRMAPSVKPVAFLADPPQVSRLHMLLPPPALLGIGEISSTHKGIVVICADKCYLLYDASNNHLTAIPPVPDSISSRRNFFPLGRSAVLVSTAGADDDYIFADIVTSLSPRGINPALPKATIFAWVKNGGEWIRSSIPHLPLPPHLCGPTYFFHIDAAFSFAGTIFWVDLLKGILICDDVLSPQGPRLVFVPLPHCLDVHDKPRHCFGPNEHRSIGCVSGAIKFLALIGYSEASCPENEMKLKTWALSPDFKHWKEETTLTVGDIWASESFNEIGLPHVLPFSPVLSVNEDGIMYAVLNDVEEEPIPDQLNVFGESLGMQLVPKANYMIRFDMLQNKVLSSTKISKKATLHWVTNTFFATDFSAYLQDHQNAEAAGKVGASVKGKRKRMSSRQAGRSKRQGQA